MKTKATKISIVAAAILGLVAVGSTPSIAGNSQQEAKTAVNLTVTNLQGISGDEAARKLADSIRVQACVVAADATVAPSAPDLTCRSLEVNEDAAAINGDNFTSTFDVATPAADVTVRYAFFVSNKSTRDLGLDAYASPATLVNVTSAGADAGVSHALPTRGTVVEGGKVGDGKGKVAVNFTVTNFPTYYNAGKGKEKLRSLIKVDVYQLAADATTAPATAAELSDAAKATKKTYEENTKPTVVNGVLNGSVNIKVPTAADATVQNYAVYLTLGRHKEKGVAAQVSAGQFVTATKDAVTGVWTVTAGLNGLTLDFSANGGNVANPAVVSVPGDLVGSNWAVLVTKTDSKGNVRTIGLVAIPVGATSVALPAGIEKGTYSAQLVQLNGSASPFTLDGAKNLASPLTLGYVAP